MAEGVIGEADMVMRVFECVRWTSWGKLLRLLYDCC